MEGLQLDILWHVCPLPDSSQCPLTASSSPNSMWTSCTGQLSLFLVTVGSSNLSSGYINGSLYGVLCATQHGLCYPFSLMVPLTVRFPSRKLCGQHNCPQALPFPDAAPTCLIKLQFPGLASNTGLISLAHFPLSVSPLEPPAGLPIVVIARDPPKLLRTFSLLTQMMRMGDKRMWRGGCLLWPQNPRNMQDFVSFPTHSAWLSAEAELQRGTQSPALTDPWAAVMSGATLAFTLKDPTPGCCWRVRTTL
jgi:hypothetical protein